MTSSDTQLKIEDLSTVRDALTTVAQKFLTFGSKISVPPHILAEIEKANYTFNEKLYKVLEHRLKQLPLLTWHAQHLDYSIGPPPPPSSLLLPPLLPPLLPLAYAQSPTCHRVDSIFPILQFFTFTSPMCSTASNAPTTSTSSNAFTIFVCVCVCVVYYSRTTGYDMVY